MPISPLYSRHASGAYLPGAFTCWSMSTGLPSGRSSPPSRPRPQPNSGCTPRPGPRRFGHGRLLAGARRLRKPSRVARVFETLCPMSIPLPRADLTDPRLTSTRSAHHEPSHSPSAGGRLRILDRRPQPPRAPASRADQNLDQVHPPQQLRPRVTAARTCSPFARNAWHARRQRAANRLGEFGRQENPTRPRPSARHHRSDRRGD